jgi:hypothetical protein
MLRIAPERQLLVVAGLDPAIHPLSKMLLLKIDGYAASPRMTAFA